MTAVFPGSFDPITCGHMDIIERASQFADRLIVAVLRNSDKTFTFSAAERVDLIKESVRELSFVDVISFDGLLVDFLKQNDIHLIIKGVRTVKDYEYEQQIAWINKNLWADAETLLMPTNQKYAYLSSSIVKEIAAYNGDISTMVPDCVKRTLLNSSQ